MDERTNQEVRIETVTSGTVDVAIEDTGSTTSGGRDDDSISIVQARLALASEDESLTEMNIRLRGEQRAPGPETAGDKKDDLSTD